MNNPEPGAQTPEQLMGDLRLVIENAEELLKNTDSYTSDHYQLARSKLAMALQSATEELLRIEDDQLTRMIEATRLASERHADASGEAKILRAFDFS